MASQAKYRDSYQILKHRANRIITKKIQGVGFNLSNAKSVGIVSTVIATLYAMTAVVFIASGLTMSGMGLRAYIETSRNSMLLLAIGFALAVAGAAATLISAFLYGFDDPEWLLLVQSAFFTFGMLFVIFSIVKYDV